MSITEYSQQNNDVLQKQCVFCIFDTTKHKYAFFLTGNTVPMLGHSICLQYRPHCSHLGDEMQRSHSGKKRRGVFFSAEIASNKMKPIIHQDTK